MFRNDCRRNTLASGSDLIASNHHDSYGCPLSMDAKDFLATSTASVSKGVLHT